MVTAAPRAPAGHPCCRRAAPHAKLPSMTTREQQIPLLDRSLCHSSVLLSAQQTSLAAVPVLKSCVALAFRLAPRSVVWLPAQSLPLFTSIDSAPTIKRQPWFATHLPWNAWFLNKRISQPPIRLKNKRHGRCTLPLVRSLPNLLSTYNDGTAHSHTARHCMLSTPHARKHARSLPRRHTHTASPAPNTVEHLKHTDRYIFNTRIAI